MNTQEIDIIIGIIIGASVSGMFASACWIHLCRKAGLPVPPDDAPFRPVTDSDLRLIRVCDNCRRYQGEDRVITKGQHLSVVGTLCPRCAAHRANVSAANLKPAIA